MKSAQGEMSKQCDSEQPVGCRDRTKKEKIKKQSRFFFSLFSLFRFDPPTVASLLPLPQRAAMQGGNI